MSYDLAVWKGPRPSKNEEALAEYQRRYDVAMAEPTDPSPEIVACLRRGPARRFPDLGEPGDDESPWASGPLLSEASGDFIYFPMTYSGAEAALPFCVEMAQKHGLVCFDPQSIELLPAVHRKPGLFGRRR